MQDFWFYTELGFHHVMDPAAYDHILFLIALAAPFTFKAWKQVIILATVFTVAHCISLALSVYDLLRIDTFIIELLIPVTIFVTALFNVFYMKRLKTKKTLGLHLFATAFFGLIHGFGFSNYFNLLMAEEPDKLVPLLGFATGIEVSQVLIILFVLLCAYITERIFKLRHATFGIAVSIIVALITIPLLIKAF